jgi:hemerythrin-like domain-containing protein
MQKTSFELKEEHKKLEEMLLDFEAVMSEQEVNYSALIHNLRTLSEFWNSHERKEEVFFQELRQRNISIPVESLTFEHGKLRRDLKKLVEAINNGKESLLRERFESEGQDLIDNLREHMKQEDWIFIALPLEDII